MYFEPNKRFSITDKYIVKSYCVDRVITLFKVQFGGTVCAHFLKLQMGDWMWIKR